MFISEFFLSPSCFTDSIEANVSNAEVYVESATQQLNSAAGYQVHHVLTLSLFQTRITLFLMWNTIGQILSNESSWTLSSSKKNKKAPWKFQFFTTAFNSYNNFANLSCNLKACTCMAYVYATFMLFLLYYIEAQVNCINAFIFIFY